MGEADLLSEQPRVDLDCRGTALQLLERTSARLGVEVWLKRDDRTGMGLSGNKVRKLEYLLGDAEAQGATVLLTCGGIQSNHCRATAVAARMRGLDVCLLLRGEPPLWRTAGGRLEGSLDGNLLLDALLGAHIRWVDQEGWSSRMIRLVSWATELRDRGERPYVIGEGGSNAVGALGFAAAAQELRQQCEQRELDFDHIVVATGSGGTLAGLAAGFGGKGPHVNAVAVCDDAPYFEAIVTRLGAVMGSRFRLPTPEPGRGWSVVEGFKGQGYGLSTPEELRVQARLAREEGIFVDPVYTGKAWVALEAMAREGRLGRRVLFWHTGGLFGLFGRGHEVAGALDLTSYFRWGA